MCGTRGIDNGQAKRHLGSERIKNWMVFRLFALHNSNMVALSRAFLTNIVYMSTRILVSLDSSKFSNPLGKKKNSRTDKKRLFLRRLHELPGTVQV